MIGFRVDANEVIATGHLMRCIAIAKACEKRGERVLFFLAEKKETERLDAAGFPYIILGTDWRHLEGEADRMSMLARENALDWLVVDSYQATKDYLRALEQSVRVLYVDDYGQECYEISAVLNYSPWMADLGEKLYQGRRTKTLFGGQYIPLREEFSDIRQTERGRAVLVTTGGTDAYNVAGKFLSECAEKERWRDTVFHVIVGSMNSHERELRALAERHSFIRLHKNVSNMSYYMKRCKAAVSAGGTTLYELCACGIPTVCFSFADNQRMGTREMGRRGVMAYVGDVRTEEDFYEKMADAVWRIMSREEEWNELSAKMQRLVDGKGAERIAEFLLKK